MASEKMDRSNLGLTARERYLESEDWKNIQT